MARALSDATQLRALKKKYKDCYKELVLSRTAVHKVREEVLAAEIKILTAERKAKDWEDRFDLLLKNGACITVAQIQPVSFPADKKA